LYVATVASRCFKSISNIAYGMCMRNDWRRKRRSGRSGQRLGRRGQCPERCGPTVGVFAHSLCGQHPNASIRIGLSNAS
jgi:hypothetical protein